MDEETKRKLKYIDGEITGGQRDPTGVQYLKETRRMILSQKQLKERDYPVGFLNGAKPKLSSNPFIRKAQERGEL